MTFKRYFIMLDSKFIGNAFFCEVIYSTVGLMATETRILKVSCADWMTKLSLFNCNC